MGMYNQSAIECVRSLLGTEQTNELYTQAGFKKRIIPLLSYPIAPIMELTLLASKALEARGLGFEQAIDRIGQGYVLTYLDSPMGAVLKRATAGDPWRVLMAVPMAYKTTLSYGVRSVERLGPGEALFKGQGDFLGPLTIAAVLRTGLRSVSGKDLTVSVTSTARNAFDYTLSLKWPV